MTVRILEGTGIDNIAIVLKYGKASPFNVVAKRFFDSIGYKVVLNNTFDKMFFYVVKDFQRHTFPDNSKEWDGVIGPKTKGKMFMFDGNNNQFCPEVYESILNNEEPIVNAYILEKYLLDPVLPGLKRSLLRGLSWAFLDAACLYDINVLHIIAHAVLESDWGNSYIARLKNNLFGWGAYDSSPVKSAKVSTKYANNILEWAAWWKRQYLLESGKYYNGNHERGVNVKYATSPIAGINKSFIVKELRRKVHAIELG